MPTDKDMDKDKQGLLPIVPRLLDVHLAAIYLSVGEQTIRDWVADGILNSVKMPGTALRDQRGHLIAKPRQRRLAKILLDREDINRLIESRKAQER